MGKRGPHSLLLTENVQDLKYDYSIIMIEVRVSHLKNIAALKNSKILL